MNAKKKGPADRVLASNRKARHDYHILETLEAGMVLTGTEVKAARAGKIQLKDSYVTIQDGQAWLVNAHFSPYSHGNRENHEPERPRKLLLHRREIDRLMGKLQTTGLTVVPLAIVLQGPWIKAEVALVQGKKLYDKRETERRKTQEKEAREAIKQQRW
ncbi:MAG: SsrA-binding protein SmpB [Acidobacteria bacterium]|nr:SsrA-binding protein SmpB [Acidobacteriota bacterium]